MFRLATFSAFLLVAACPAFAQHVPDSAGLLRNVSLNEVVVKDRPLKTFHHAIRAGIPHYWLFQPGFEKRHLLKDSCFNLSEVPALCDRSIRLRYLNFHLKAWDTTRMRLNMIVLQVNDGDTTYWIRPLPMRVRRNWLRVSLDDAGVTLKPGAFWVGYAFAAYSIPEEFNYRVFTTNVDFRRSAVFTNGRLELFNQNVHSFDFPFRIEYDEI